MAKDETIESLDEGRITFGEEVQAYCEDPVCKMEVDPSLESTPRVEMGDKTYYFCSQDCRESFVADPGKFLDL